MALMLALKHQLVTSRFCVLTVCRARGEACCVGTTLLRRGWVVYVMCWGRRCAEMSGVEVHHTYVVEPDLLDPADRRYVQTGRQNLPNHVDWGSHQQSVWHADVRRTTGQSQTDRQTDRQKDRQTERQRDRETGGRTTGQSSTQHVSSCERTHHQHSSLHHDLDSRSVALITLVQSHDRRVQLTSLSQTHEVSWEQGVYSWGNRGLSGLYHGSIRRFKISSGARSF